jgi:membrane protein DedA with SNARE-associated domain
MEWFERFGYPALALLVLLEGVGIPTPAVTVVVAASALARHGELSLPAVAAVTFLAAAAGDNLGYLLGRRAGRPAILRWGARVGLTDQRLARAERFLDTRGRNIIVVARFIDGLRQTNGLIAGAMGMRWRHYAVRDAVGAALWTALWVTAGAVAGGHVDLLAPIVAVAVIAIALLWLIRYFVRRAARNR